jgi:hypothetical protein
VRAAAYYSGQSFEIEEIMQWLRVAPFAFNETIKQENTHVKTVLYQGYKIYC